MRTWSYVPTFDGWIVKIKAQRIKDISWLITDPIEYEVLMDAFWDDYMSAVESINNYLSLCATEHVMMESGRKEDVDVRTRYSTF